MAIDHIFVAGAGKDAVKRFERYSPEYYFPISDHSPAYIDIEF
jgi:exonuclease III